MSVTPALPKVFVSYSHEDEDWKDALVEHLKGYELDEILEIWDDRRIAGGGDWLREIEEAMDSADAALLLISRSFLASEFIRRKEVPRLLERRRSEGLLVLPVIVKPSVWRDVDWLAKIQCRPKDGVALLSLDEAPREQAMADIALEIKSHLVQRRPGGAGDPPIDAALLRRVDDPEDRPRVVVWWKPESSPAGAPLDPALCSMVRVSGPEEARNLLYADRFPVTVAQVEQFLGARGRRGAVPPAAEDVPVTHVSWDEAVDYAGQLGKRLPSRREWLRVAGLGHAEEPFFPWGKDWQEGRCNHRGLWGLDTPRLVSVRRHGPQNPGGIWDIVGNAAEMASDGGRVVQCGGSFSSAKSRIGLVARPFDVKRHLQVGYRCVAHVEDYVTAVARDRIFELPETS